MSRRATALDTVKDLDDAVALSESSDAEQEHKKLVGDIRDRLAYVHVTGLLPTHLRESTLRLMKQATEHAGSGKSGVDGEGGGMIVKPGELRRFGVVAHPMVAAAVRLVQSGYRLVHAREGVERRPFGRVWMSKPLGEGRAVNATLHANGAVSGGHS